MQRKERVIHEATNTRVHVAYMSSQIVLDHQSLHSVYIKSRNTQDSNILMNVHGFNRSSHKEILSRPMRNFQTNIQYHLSRVRSYHTSVTEPPPTDGRPVSRTVVFKLITVKGQKGPRSEMSGVTDDPRFMSLCEWSQRKHTYHQRTRPRTS